MNTTHLQHYTKKDLALLLRVTTRTIENYVSKGVLPAPKKVGGKALWPVSAVAPMLELRVAGETLA